MSRVPEMYEDIDEATLEETMSHWAEGPGRKALPYVLSGLEAECHWLDEKDEREGRQHAARKARTLAAKLADKHREQPDFFRWSRRRLNRQDFEYLFYHRERQNSIRQEQLEIIAAKITFTKKDGSQGYFNKLERNVGWTDYITPVLFSGSRQADDLVRCSLWVNSRNSGRCRKADFCPCCLWNDYLKVLVQAFGVRSAAFQRARAWSFITCGFTTSRKNSKAIGRGLEADDYHYMRGDHFYDPYPIRIGTDDNAIDLESFGWDDARVLGMIIQDALDELYSSTLISGYRNKLEGAFKIGSGVARRLNLHGHSVANGEETNMQAIAKVLYRVMLRGVKKHAKSLSRLYYPDVLVLRIPTAEDLQRCIAYSEKVVAINHIFADAMRQPGAIAPDGLPVQSYVLGVQESLRELIDDDVESIFTRFTLHQDTQTLRRRKTVGNMRFSDEPGACIGDEPKWHVASRHEEAKRKREQRAAKKARDEAMGVVRVKKPLRRRRRERVGNRLQRRRLKSRVQPVRFELESVLRAAATRITVALGSAATRPPARNDHINHDLNPLRFGEFVLQGMKKNESGFTPCGDVLISHKVQMTCVQTNLLRAATLSPTARLLYAVLTTHTGPDHPGDANPGSDLNKQIGLSDRALVKYEAELERHGWLHVHKIRDEHGRFAKHYVLLTGPAGQRFLDEDD